MEEFQGAEKKKEVGFKAKVISTGGRSDKGMPGILLGQSGSGLLRNQILSFSVCVRQRDGEETNRLAVKMWSNTVFKLLNAVLEQGDYGLLSEMVLCAETGQGETAAHS